MLEIRISSYSFLLKTEVKLRKTTKHKLNGNIMEILCHDYIKSFNSAKVSVSLKCSMTLNLPKLAKLR